MRSHRATIPGLTLGCALVLALAACGGQGQEPAALSAVASAAASERATEPATASASPEAPQTASAAASDEVSNAPLTTDSSTNAPLTKEGSASTGSGSAPAAGTVLSGTVTIMTAAEATALAGSQWYSLYDDLGFSQSDPVAVLMLDSATTLTVEVGAGVSGPITEQQTHSTVMLAEEPGEVAQWQGRNGQHITISYGGLYPAGGSDLMSRASGMPTAYNLQIVGG